MAEGLTLVEVIERRDAVDGPAAIVDFIDVEPPVTDEEMDDMMADPRFYEFRGTEPALHARELIPDRGGEFTEFDCAKLDETARENGLVFDPNGFATQIAELLRRHGRKVELVLGMPLELRRHKFLGFVPQSPPEAEQT